MNQLPIILLSVYLGILGAISYFIFISFVCPVFKLKETIKKGEAEYAEHDKIIVDNLDRIVSFINRYETLRNLIIINEIQVFMFNLAKHFTDYNLIESVILFQKAFHDKSKGKNIVSSLLENREYNHFKTFLYGSYSSNSRIFNSKEDDLYQFFYTRHSAINKILGDDHLRENVKIHISGNVIRHDYTKDKIIPYKESKLRPGYYEVGIKTIEHHIDDSDNLYWIMTTYNNVNFRCQIDFSSDVIMEVDLISDVYEIILKDYIDWRYSSIDTLLSSILKNEFETICDCLELDEIILLDYKTLNTNIQNIYKNYIEGKHQIQLPAFITLFQHNPITGSQTEVLFNLEKYIDKKFVGKFHSSNLAATICKNMESRGYKEYDINRRGGIDVTVQ